MPAEPERSSEPVSERVTRSQGPALVLASAGPAESGEPRPGPPPRDKPDPQPDPGSLADLRNRLEQLPRGHPSSPYHDDGERKPPPPRLKHLELAPPPRATPATTAPAPVPARGTAAAAAAQPPERHAPAASPWIAPPPPASPAAAAPPPASPRTAQDGSWAWGQVTLGRDLVRVAQDAYDRFRAAEGRDLFGQYGNGGLTPMLHRIADRVTCGRLADDTDQHALLERDVFLARFADLRDRHPDRAPEQLARHVPGALSYCFMIDAGQYSDGIVLVQDALELQGFQLQARRNAWSNQAARCVLTIWRDPLTDLPFEVQFQAAAIGYGKK